MIKASKQYSIKQMENQLSFCEELMRKLTSSVWDEFEYEEDGFRSYYSIPNGCRIANDIIRLRRELNDLRKMITYRGEDDD